MSESAVDRWLADLGADTPSVERLLVGRFTGIVERLIARDAAGTEVARAIVKRPVPGRRPRIGESFLLEARRLGELARLGGVRAPALYAASHDPPVLVMEDVASRPVSFGHGASLHHGLVAMGALTRLHRAAPVAELPAFSDYAFRHSLATAYRDGWHAFRAELLALVPSFERVGDALVDQHESVAEALAEPARTLHGDAHFENIPLRVQGDDVVMFDWQGPRLGHPILDVAYFIAMSYPPSARRRYERRLVEHHHRDLGGAFDPFVYYRLGLALRAAQCVELIANAADPTLLSHRAFRMVARRCFTAAAEHPFILPSVF